MFKSEIHFLDQGCETPGLEASLQLLVVSCFYVFLCFEGMLHLAMILIDVLLFFLF